MKQSHLRARIVKMENLIVVVSLCVSFLFTLVSSEFHIEVDDILNSDFVLFPNVTVFHQTNLEDQTLERFKRVMEDDDVVRGAYSTFKVFQHFDIVLIRCCGWCVKFASAKIVTFKSFFCLHR